MYSNADADANKQSFEQKQREVEERMEAWRRTVQYLLHLLMSCARDNLGGTFAKLLLQPMLQRRLEARARDHADRFGYQAGLLIIKAEVRLHSPASSSCLMVSPSSLCLNIP